MYVNFKANLELYKVFYMTAMLGSMTKTAESLYIGQPAVSKSIKTLEGELGVPLFVRGARGLSPTSAGKVLFEHVSKAMEQIQLGEESISNMQEQIAETVKIEICAMQFKLLILPYLKTFYESCQCSFDISPITDTFASMKRLKDGKIDCCVLTRPINLRNFKFVQLYTFHDYLIGSPDYISGIAAGGDFFKRATLISVMNESIMSSYEQARLKDIRINNKMKVTSMDHTISLVKLGQGIGFIAEELVQEQLSSGQLVKLDIPSTYHKRDVGFLLNKNAQTNEALLNFIDYFGELYSHQQIGGMQSLQLQQVQ